MMFRRLLPTICSLTCLYAARIPAYDYIDDSYYYELKSLLGAPESLRGDEKGDVPHEVNGWASGLHLGQVAGVSVDLEGRPVIFHRGPHVWNYKSFNATHHYQGGGGPIKEDPVLVLDPDNGKVVHSWGRGLFILPHGITIDDHGNTWLTDVALHQVFKFAAEAKSPELTLGEAKVPGSDDKHLCKPTSIAVAKEGHFFVADGYCNSRILHFDKDGKLLEKYGHFGGEWSESGLYVPHGIALDEGRDTVCVADRENRRIVCVRAGLHHHTFGTPVRTLQPPSRARVFDIDIKNGVLVGVGGTADEGNAVGFTTDLSSENMQAQWAPRQGFRNPHAIAISRDGAAVYVAEIGPNRVWKFTVGNTFMPAKI